VSYLIVTYGFIAGDIEECAASVNATNPFKNYLAKENNEKCLRNIGNTRIGLPCHLA